RSYGDWSSDVCSSDLGSAYMEMEAGLGFERVRTVAELEQRLQQSDRPVMLDFYADWCVSCKEMEQFTYRDARVAERLQDLLLLRSEERRVGKECRSG